MTDTTVTTTPPPAAPPQAPAAPANEAVINTNTSNSPNPITNAAPDKPVSRREAIERAFQRADARSRGEPPQAKDAKPQAKEAKAEKGHNNPPADAEPKLNLKKRPSEQDAKTLEAPPAQPRDRGRFARREQAPGDGEGVDAPTGQQQQQAKPKQLPETAPYRDPPQRMSEAAKAAWADTPETVRGDIHRVQQEFSKAFQAYKGAADAYAPIARFDQMARQSGTTLDKALTNYTNMEHKLRTDLIGGLDVIINNLGLKGQNGQRITLRDVAYHVLNQSPEQLKQVQMGNAQQAQHNQIGALHQEIQGLKQQLMSMHNQQQFVQTRSQVDQFADSHPRFDELGPLIKQELELGFDLETAYRRAELLQPATTAAQTRATAPQTRTTEADKSVSGAPAGANAPTVQARRKTEKPVGRREAIANAIKRVNGGL